jgi:hypothetical protein
MANITAWPLSGASALNGSQSNVPARPSTCAVMTAVKVLA